MRRKKDPDSTCYVCGSPYVDLHHIFEGNWRRDISDKYEFCQVWLCRKHHAAVHNFPNMGLDLELKKMAQESYERMYSRDEFIREFGKSYL